MAADFLHVAQNAGWGAGGGVLAGLFPLIGERRIPQSERAIKDALWFVVTFILLPAIGAFFAVLAHSQCSEIDAKTCVFVGFAAPSLLQKWSGDSLNL